MNTREKAFKLLVQLTAANTELLDLMETEDFDALSIFEDIESLFAELESELELHFDCEEEEE